jgi:hypothetical protein
MNTFIDNTGLHSAFRALEGQAKGSSDIQGLLQFATFLVFSHSISINGFETHNIGNRTKEIKEVLIDLGLNKNTLSIIPFEEDDYFKTCEIVAESISKDLEISFNPTDIHFEIFGLEPDGATFHSEKLDTLHFLLTKNYTDERIEDILQMARNDRSSSIGLYMLAKNKNLILKTKLLVAKFPKWTKKTYLVIQYLS